MESKQSPESDRRRGESSLRASQWNDVLDCRWKLWVFAGDRVCERECVCVHMWLTVGFCILACVFVLEKENQRL